MASAVMMPDWPIDESEAILQEDEGAESDDIAEMSDDGDLEE
jgi:hypothetical protein